MTACVKTLYRAAYDLTQATQAFEIFMRKYKYKNFFSLSDK